MDHDCKYFGCELLIYVRICVIQRWWTVLDTRVSREDLVLGLNSDALSETIEPAK